jgi:hypothetical protein
MKIRLNDRGQKTLRSFRHWHTENERETTLEFEPILLKINNCLRINSTHKAADGRRRSNFIHVLTLGDVVTLRNFLNEVLAVAEHTLLIKPEQNGTD